MNVSFAVPFEGFLLRGDTYEAPCPAVVLHGAGKSSRRRFSRLRQALQERGVPTAAFDFIGHGETGGNLIGSSLRSRTEQAAAVIQQVGQEPLTLLGASMSAYTAIKLTERFRVEHLILLVPAIYTARAYSLPFGPEFSCAIREPKSWRESDAWGILARFRGNLLVFAAEEDAVIPSEVVERIYDCARQSRMRKIHIVPGSHHIGLFPTDQDVARAAEMIAEMIRGTPNWE